MTWLAVRTVIQAAAVLKHKSDEGVEMYSTTFLANGICDLPNSLEGDPHIFLTEQDRKCMKAMDLPFKEAQHA